MTKITEEIEAFRKKFNQFLDVVKEYEMAVTKEINDWEKLNTSQDNRISELEDMIDEESGLETIDCGIGEINYENPNNLVLQDVMENLESAIKKHNPKKVNEHLEAIL